MLFSTARRSIDYADAASFEAALNSGAKVNGKVVKFDVVAYKPDSALGINCWSGELLNFISKNKLDVEAGDIIVGYITQEPSKTFWSWSIHLAKDFDSKGSSTAYYINVDGTKSKPVLKKWGKATVTDGVAEHLDYLESLDFTVTIENSSQKEPYSGFTVYETDFKVSKAGFSWTMYLCIQDQDFVEYELDIHLK